MFPQKAKKCSNQLVKSAGQECFKFEKDAENVPSAIGRERPTGIYAASAA